MPQPGRRGRTGPAGPAGPQGPAGPTGSSRARIYAEDVLVAESGEINFAGGPAVVVDPDIAAGKVTVALPRGFAGLAGPQGPAGPVGPQGRQGPQGAEGPQGQPGGATVIRSVAASAATLGASPGSQVSFDLVCPPGSYPVSAHYTVNGTVTAARFIAAQSTVDLGQRTVRLTLTRSSTAVDAEIAPQAICISGTAL